MRDPRRPAPRIRRLVLLGTALAAAVAATAALRRTEPFTLAELETESGLTAKAFANLFEFFAFQFRPYVQDPHVFLQTRNGDCDDYAILADHVLSKKGLTTRIIQVRLVGTNIDHAVCYVVENKAYLDYNNRQYSFNLQRCKPLVREIAEKVADSFERNWTSAFEYTFSYGEGRKRKRWVVVKTDDPKSDPDR